MPQLDMAPASAPNSAPNSVSDPANRCGAWTGGFGPIFRREIKSYLTSPLFYVLTGGVLLVVSILFVFLLYQFSYYCSQPRGGTPSDFDRNATKFVITNSFYMIHFFMLFTLPILSMRLMAEERKTGTLELLVTYPVRDWGLLLGKYFGALAVAGFMLALTFSFPLIIALLGGQPEWNVVISCYTGLLMVSGAYLAFGLFTSSLTESQVIAAMMSYAGLFLVYISGGLLSNSPNDFVRKFAEAAGIEKHFAPFASGNIQSLDLVYFILFSAFFLFLTAQALGMRRWRV